MLEESEGERPAAMFAAVMIAAAKMVAKMIVPGAELVVATWFAMAVAMVQAMMLAAAEMVAAWVKVLRRRLKAHLVGAH